MKSSRELINLSRVNKQEIHKSFYQKEAFNLMENLSKHEFNALMILTLDTPLDLCRFLESSMFDLEDLFNYPAYKNHKIKKKRGGERQISAPEKNLKAIQRRLNYFLQAYYLCIKPEEVHGFVVNPHYLGPHCNIVQNALSHTGKKQVLNIDLKDFFPSIPARRVKDVFVSPLFQFNDQIATAITLLTTYKGKLPIGAPTSPVISNFICVQLDLELIDFCTAHGLSYSRYADDLTFSSNSIIPSDTVLDIINLIKKNKFEINTKKLRVKASNRKQTVTGLTVNEKVNVDRKLLKKVRAMLHDLSTHGVHHAVQNHFNTVLITQNHNAKFIHRLEGYINFIGQVRGKNDTLYLKFKSEFDGVFA